MALASCATPLQPNQTRVVITSNPPGAIISTATVPAKQSQLELLWTLKQTTAVSEPITATWVSGAKASVKLNLVAGKEQTYVIQRPANVPGVDLDVKWAIHLGEVQALENAVQNAPPPPPPVQNNPQSVYCNSTKMGNTVTTNCF
jgi:hypothetical protein